MPLLQIKNFFILYVINHEIFQFGGACLSELLKFDTLKFKGKGCSYLVLSLINGNESVSVMYSSAGCVSKS